MEATIDHLVLATQLSVALATGAVAIVLLAADPRRNWNQWLAFFLVLVSGNFLCAGVEGLLSVAGATGRLPEADAARWGGMLRSAGFVFLALDPFALAYFASLFPRRSGIARDLRLTMAVLLPAFVFMAAEAWGRHLSTTASGVVLSPWRPVFFAYLAACYLYASFRLVASYADEPSDVMARKLGLVTAGVLVTAVPRAPLVLADLGPELRTFWRSLGDGAGTMAEITLRIGALWLLFALTRAAFRKRVVTRARGREGTRMFRFVALAFALFTTIWAVERVPTALTRVGADLPQAVLTLSSFAGEAPAFSARWLVFTGAMVYGVVHHQILAADPRVLGTVGTAGTAGVTFVAVGTASLVHPWAGAAVAATLSAGGLVAVARLRAVRVAPDGRLRAWRTDAYRALIATALAEGPLTEARRRELEVARQRLHVPERVHEVLLAIAETENAHGRGGRVLLGRYVIVKHLASGGYATVHLAHDREEDRPVVVKHLQDAFTGAGATETAARREMEVAARVSHPNVVAIHDLAALDDGLVIVMEYLDGGSVRDVLRREAPVPPARVQEIVAPALEGLASLHEAGLVHGDVKPENILVAADGTTKLADFGTVRAAPRDTHTRVDATGAGAPGTVLYMAPEQAQGAQPTRGSDLYAMGAVVHELVTGRPPVDPADRSAREVIERIRHGDVAPASNVPSSWRAFLTRALAADPRKRYRSAVEMCAALRAAAQEAQRTRAKALPHIPGPD